jgi:hypothetical protein
MRPADLTHPSTSGFNDFFFAFFTALRKAILWSAWSGEPLLFLQRFRAELQSLFHHGGAFA